MPELFEEVDEVSLNDATTLKITGSVKESGMKLLLGTFFYLDVS